MTPAPDIVIRHGLVVDGSGGEPYAADVAVTGDTITGIGAGAARGRNEIDATGCIVTPGFIDAHSHLDGNVTWECRLKPNSGHGVTTTIIGNCGVGFAPCRERDREFTVALMEGVEDIPAGVLWAGLPWNWESYPEYRAFLAARRFDMHVGGLLPHSCLRVFVMGERAINGEPAALEDIARMEALTYEALRAGACGVGSTRLTSQRTLSGTPAPSIAAREDELTGIARAIARAGRGVLQIAPEFNQFPRAEEELRMVVRVARATGCRVTYSLKQSNHHKDGWKRLLEITDEANREGLDVRPMVFGRPTGDVLGWECSVHPFVHSPAYRPLAELPLARRVAELKKAEVRGAILSQTQRAAAERGAGWGGSYRLLFPIGEVPDYEPPPQDSVASLAERAGVHPTEIIYDAMMRDEGRGALLSAYGNYADGNLDPSLAMMRFPRSVLGLADAGAHCTIICDASAPTTMLSYWARDRTRGARLPLPEVVRRLTSDAAGLFDLDDRGVVRVGMKADLNVIDHARLRLYPPRMEYDLPTGGKRLVQDAVGYRATLVGGVVAHLNDRPTEALPGQLV
jgi:N-acyl-D-amino-acid deacylase